MDLNFNLFLTNRPLYYFIVSNARWFYFRDQWKSSLMKVWWQASWLQKAPRSSQTSLFLVHTCSNLSWESTIIGNRRRCIFQIEIIPTVWFWSDRQLYGTLLWLCSHLWWKFKIIGILKILTKKWEPGFNPLPPRPAKFGQNRAVCYFTPDNFTCQQIASGWERANWACTCTVCYLISSFIIICWCENSNGHYSYQLTVYN